MIVRFGRFLLSILRPELFTKRLLFYFTLQYALLTVEYNVILLNFALYPFCYSKLTHSIQIFRTHNSDLHIILHTRIAVIFLNTESIYL